MSKEFSKAESLYFCKEFLVTKVLDTTNGTKVFEATALAAANSGELTTLFYKSTNGNEEGLILGFWSRDVNKFGLRSQGYEFKNFTVDSAYKFLERIQHEIDTYSRFLNKKDYNIFFNTDGIDVLISNGTFGYEIRLFWDGFDAIWESTAFERSVNRFKRKEKSK